MDLLSALRDLYAAAPDAFVAERKRLAAELQASGERAAAATLRKAAKPPLPLWALNQVARRRPALIEHLLETGRRMGVVHRELAGGAGAEAFRQTSADYRRAIADVVAAAQAVLREAGSAADGGAARRLERTLEGLPFTDAERQTSLREGRLADESDGADAVSALTLLAGEVALPGRPRAPAPAPAAPPGRAVARSEPPPGRADERRRAEAAEQARVQEREREARDRQAEAREARRAAEHAAQAAERARAAAAAGSKLLAGAEAGLQRAREALDAAQTRARELEGQQRELDAAAAAAGRAAATLEAEAERARDAAELAASRAANP